MIVPGPRPANARQLVINAKYQPIFFGTNNKIIETIPRSPIAKKRIETIATKLRPYLKLGKVKIIHARK